VTACQFETRTLTAYEAQQLRDDILRAGLPPGSVYRTDLAADTLHVGAFVDNALVAVATVCSELFPEEPERPAWRLRGMATRPAWQGQGLGSQLARRCISHATDHGGNLIWCTARASAFPFYRALGFEVCGPSFRRSEYDREWFAKMMRELP